MPHSVPGHVIQRLYSSVARVVAGSTVHVRTIRALPTRIVGCLAEAADGNVDDTLGTHAVVLHVVERLPIESVQGRPPVPTSVGFLAMHGAADEILFGEATPLLAVQLLEARRDSESRAGGGASQEAVGLAPTVLRFVDRHDPVWATADADLGVVDSLFHLTPLSP